MRKMKKIYYHYTSIQVLYSIICSHTLWLSNLMNSNDPDEFYLNCSDFNKYIENMGVDPFNGKPYILEDNGILGKNYGMCFSSLNDNLSQWERYGDHLQGVAIGFDIELLQKLLIDNYDFKFDFYSMKYNENEKINFLKNQIKRMKKFDTHCPLAQFTIEGLYFSLYYGTCRAVFKREAFSIEKEFRLFFDPKYFNFIHSMSKQIYGDRFSALLEKGELTHKNVKEKLHLLEEDKKFALMRNGINSYLSLDLNLLGDSHVSVIEEIILGPKSTQDINELKDFCKKNGFTPLIKKSDVIKRTLFMKKACV